MSQPYDALPAGFNGTLLQILEAYRDLSDERDRLERRINEEVESRLAERSATQQAESLWEEERRTYKAEVKRLELVIAKGKRGVADVALVRQDSLIRRRKQAITPADEDDGKETVFEFLEKTKRFEDPSWSGQRGTLTDVLR
jgi:cell division septum initiation protein DivIVA